MKKVPSVLIAAMLVLIISLSAWAAQDDIIGVWQLGPENFSGSRLVAVKGLDGTVNGQASFVDGPYGRSMYFNGSDNRILLYKGAPSGVQLPVKELTIEAWVKIETRSSWTGIFNYVQDNGSYERGFYLGVVDGKLGGYIATVRDGGTPRLDWVAWDGAFDSAAWYHVAFTYDGARMKLYIDGAMVRESAQASGGIVYPEASFLAIGAYMDDNETGPFKGAIREVRLYSRALTEAEIRASVPGSLASPANAAEAKPGTIKVLAAFKDGSTLLGVLLRVEGDDIVLVKPDGEEERINSSKLLALLPVGN